MQLLEAEGGSSDEEAASPPTRKKAARNVSLSDDEEEMASTLGGVRAVAREAEHNYDSFEEEDVRRSAGEDEGLEEPYGVNDDVDDDEMDLGGGDGNLSNEVLSMSFFVTMI